MTNKKLNVLVRDIFLNALRDRKGAITPATRKLIIEAFVRQIANGLLYSREDDKSVFATLQSKLDADKELFEAFNFDSVPSQIHSQIISQLYLEAKLNTKHLASSADIAWILAPIYATTHVETIGYSFIHAIEFEKAVTKVVSDIAVRSNLSESESADLVKILTFPLIELGVKAHYSYLTSLVSQQRGEELVDAREQLLLAEMEATLNDREVNEINYNLFLNLYIVDFLGRLESNNADPFAILKLLLESNNQVTQRVSLNFILQTLNSLNEVRNEFERRYDNKYYSKEVIALLDIIQNYVQVKKPNQGVLAVLLGAVFELRHEAKYSFIESVDSITCERAGFSKLN